MVELVDLCQESGEFDGKRNTIASEQNSSGFVISDKCRKALQCEGFTDARLTADNDCSFLVRVVADCSPSSLR